MTEKILVLKISILTFRFSQNGNFYPEICIFAKGISTPLSNPLQKATLRQSLSVLRRQFRLRKPQQNYTFHHGLRRIMRVYSKNKK